MARRSKNAIARVRRTDVGLSCVAYRERRHRVSRPDARHCIGALSLAAIERAHKSRRAVRRTMPMGVCAVDAQDPEPLEFIGARSCVNWRDPANSYSPGKWLAL